ncbi:hypothetical protein DFH07DRAFT_777394 [Mycena maculata]|uniref:Uncharacterized protein n=1 Tax=Mycena maculata TaxID=230809 RepID=A0AAD7N420_9AGAR|nr:hypothetical protein DFH07DRAFT_777394 [Mycena maculata]
MSIDLLKNRIPEAPLGPFDGRVGAILRVGAETFFVTTNTDYVPQFVPISTTHPVSLRNDMRYGLDDPTLWPQKYSPTYCHLAAIPKPEERPDLAVMWWNPTPGDFEVGSAVTRGLGKLKFPQLVPFITAMDDLRTRIRKYTESTNEIHSLFPRLTASIDMALDRLRSLPSTYEKMVFGFTSMQRSYLELEALLSYMSVYKPRMESSDSKTGDLVVKHCMGAFTHEPQIAQMFFKAGLPFWLIRPTYVFDTENILAVVEVSLPPFPVDSTMEHPVLYTGNDTDDKIAAMHRAALQLPWYQDPFAVDAPGQTASQETGTSNAELSQGPSSTRAASGSRYQPYARPPTSHQSHSIVGRGRGEASHGAGGGRGDQPNSKNRNKYIVYDGEEMPSVIQTWAVALSQVNTNIPSLSLRAADREYILPEPALLITPTLQARRYQFIHHWRLLRDAFLFCLGNSDRPVTLSSQEWRDVLEGRVQNRRRNARTKNSRPLEEVIAPVLHACKMDALEGYPPSQESVPAYSTDQAKQVVWELAEMNFRFELLSLDKRASGRDRRESVKMCFAGGMLVEIPMEHSQLGLASPALVDRHRYHLRLATLMLDWRTQCRRPAFIVADIKNKRGWSQGEMEGLEKAVANYYTDTFFELFGRAAVIPMRLERGIVPLPSLT